MNQSRATKARDIASTKLTVTRQRQLQKGRYAYYGYHREVLTMAYLVVDSTHEIIEKEVMGVRSYELYLKTL